MKYLKSKINHLLENSKRVLSDLALPNGAIVAANTDCKYYPHSAKDYRYVWPRDAAYICIAADYLNLKIQEPYFKWLEECPEDFKKEELLYQTYATNGRKFGFQFQPDQMGISLWVIWHHFKNDLPAAQKYEKLIRRLADGICSEWKGLYFFKNTYDLWEEGYRKTSTKMENNFTYSLAACADGLEKASLIFSNNKNWEKASQEMKKKIDEAYSHDMKYFSRNYGKIIDPNIDASLLGLVYPFEIIEAKDKRMINTVKKIEEKIVINGGVHRYELDYYDGEGTSQEGAGAWPLLNFWMSIYWSLSGNRRKALKYFNWVIERLDNDFIPEQIFEDFREGCGIKPLGWSHAMFVIAYYKIMGSR